MKLLWFTAGWCRPCKNMVPIIDELQDDHPSLVVEKIDVEAHPSLAQQHGVLGLPTFVFMENERETGRMVGSVVKSRLVELLRK